ncbi:spermidine/putrescine ABC transporter permease [Raoultella ornithinolytica]|jgi:ABC-type spermidine/putrescine transport system permease subunit II|nr:spermidine/putrescine ABC transporter permease [Raoultella ornithinolytica]OMP90148.1 spermidine/putrescine ABC transporter permease [Raoultella terrigena]
MKEVTMTSPATLLAKGRRKLNASLPLQTLLLVLMLLAMFGPLLNLLIWTVAESWFFPHSLPSQWGLKYWYQVFSPYSDVSGSLLTSVLIAVLSVLVCLLVSIPAGYALSRRGMPLRVGFMLLFLIPQAFPNLTVYMNIARLFYQWGLNGTVAGVVLVHSVHGLMYSVWICVAAFSAVDPLLARASRNLGAGAVYTFWHIVLPQASPGIIAASIFVFLESLDEFTGTFFVGAPDITTLPLLLYNASMSGNYQVSSITALILLLPSLLFMLVIHKFMRPEMLAKMGK